MVRHLKEGESSPPAEVGQLHWIAGHWAGEAFGGTVEDVWSPPAGGSIMGAFRLYTSEGVQFYELCTIVEENNSLILRLKHFNADLTGWEEKEESVEFPLVAIKDRIAWFDGFTFERVSDDQMNIFVLVGGKDGEEVVKFAYTLQ